MGYRNLRFSKIWGSNNCQSPPSPQPQSPFKSEASLPSSAKMDKGGHCLRKPEQLYDPLGRQDSWIPGASRSCKGRARPKPTLSCLRCSRVVSRSPPSSLPFQSLRLTPQRYGDIFWENLRQRPRWVEMQKMGTNWSGKVRLYNFKLP